MEDKEQKPFEVGDYVHYSPDFPDHLWKAQNGRIKSISGSHIFVVYRCRGEWDHYKDYTGESTPKGNLHHGWVDEQQGTPIKTPEN
jgi:hypothetical protein